MESSRWVALRRLGVFRAHTPKTEGARATFLQPGEQITGIRQGESNIRFAEPMEHLGDGFGYKSGLQPIVAEVLIELQGALH